MYLFSGKIKCLDCGKNYKGKKFRNVTGYVCSGNSNYGNEFCERFMVRESDIVDLINSHYGNSEWNIEDIKSIEIKNKSITVHYTDGQQSFISANQYTI